MDVSQNCNDAQISKEAGKGRWEEGEIGELKGINRELVFDRGKLKNARYCRTPAIEQEKTYKQGKSEKNLGERCPGENGNISPRKK